MEGMHIIGRDGTGNARINTEMVNETQKCMNVV